MRSFMATWWQVTSFVTSAQLAVLAPTPGLTTPYWRPSIFKRGRAVMSQGMELLRHVECPQRSAGERLCPLAPIWANYVLVGLRRPLGPWVGSAVDAHVRIADIPPFLRGDLPPSRSQRETSTQSFKILPSGESFSHASPFHQAL
jgi:hypothetical protein